MKASNKPYTKVLTYSVLLLYCCLLSGLSAYGQHQVTGTVTDEQGFELPGVAIREKGTSSGTVTDMFGKFSYQASDSNAVLVVSFIGYRSQEIALQGVREINIILKEDCIRCFLDGYRVQLAVRSGLLKTPLGGELRLNFPAYIRQMVLSATAGYQTNLAQNSFLTLGLALSHVIVTCDYDADLAFEHREIQWEAGSAIKSYTLEGRFNYLRPLIFPHYTYLMAGWGRAKLHYQDDVRYTNRNGYRLGLGTTIGSPLYLDVIGKATYWGSFWEFQGELTREFKRLSLSAQYSKIDNFSELSLGIGISL